MDDSIDPPSLKRLVLSRNFTDAVALAELVVSFVVGSIALPHSAMAMLQAILELTHVDSFLDRVNIFTKAMPDSCFPFTGVSILAVRTIVR